MAEPTPAADPFSLKGRVAYLPGGYGDIGSALAGAWHVPVRGWRWQAAT